MEVKGHACGLSLPARPTHIQEQRVLPLQCIPLHNGWSFRQVGDDKAKWMPISQFPTNVHLDLMHNNVIPDPFVAKNEEAVQWVGEKSWIYKTAFQSPSLPPGQKAVMAFEGLDTHAMVFLNGKKVLQTKDMFTPERVDVTKHLRMLTENEIEITFQSTYLIGKRLATDDPKHKYGCWNGRSPLTFVNEPICACTKVTKSRILMALSFVEVELLMSPYEQGIRRALQFAKHSIIMYMGRATPLNQLIVVSRAGTGDRRC